MPQDEVAVPFVRQDSQPTPSDKGDLCPNGIVRHQCRWYISVGADQCYFCGYREGMNDGTVIAENRLMDQAEERWEGMD